MGAWDDYSSRINATGATKRSATIAREKRHIEHMIVDNPSYTTVYLYPAAYGHNISSATAISNRVTKNVSIINTSKPNEKKMISMPGEDIDAGSLISWMNEYWLVTERDSNTTIYTTTKIVQCNHLLKWLDTVADETISQWCVIGTASTSIGESMDGSKMVTAVDSKISMLIARNAYTVAFDRNKRFLIDDDDAPHKMAYQLSRPLKVGSVYNSKGVLDFTLQETTATEDDNHELGIADYYLQYSRNTLNATSDPTPSSTNTTGRKKWM